MYSHGLAACICYHRLFHLVEGTLVRHRMAKVPMVFRARLGREPACWLRGRLLSDPFIVLENVVANWYFPTLFATSNSGHTQICHGAEDSNLLTNE